MPQKLKIKTEQKFQNKDKKDVRNFNMAKVLLLFSENYLQYKRK